MKLRKELREAAKDLRYLLTRRYNRRGAVVFVGDRYLLNKNERHLLFRAIYPKEEVAKRKAKLVPIGEICGKILAVDGYNVLVILESLLKGLPLILADDGFVRDISGVFNKYRMSEDTFKAIDLILLELGKHPPRSVYFFFDQPISKSGELAALVRRKLMECRLEGDAKAVKQPESAVIKMGEVVASSDSVVIKRARKIVDLAGHIVKMKAKEKLLSF